MQIDVGREVRRIYGDNSMFNVAVDGYSIR